MTEADTKKRDEFPQPVKDRLAKRVGFRCSNPKCRKPTSGPKADETGVNSIGVAAHITAAARGGPRYNEALTAQERKSEGNGIWLCRICDKLIDTDKAAYPEAVLRDWKETAEVTALLELKGLKVVPDEQALLRKLEAEMPGLIAEMRSDLKENPFTREFILIGRGWSYGYDPNNPILTYYFEDHPHLRQKMRVLENHGFVQDIKFNDIDRFQMSEPLVDYLKSSI